MWELSLKKITDKTALKAARLWCKDPKKLRLVNNQINCVYLFENEGVGHFLRITHSSIRGYTEVEAAIKFQLHLMENKVSVCKVKKSQNNRYIEKINQEELEFIVHACLEAPGVELDILKLDKTTCFNWGKVLGKLHRASINYCPKNTKHLKWEEIWHGLKRYDLSNELDIKYKIDRINYHLKNIEISPSNFGLIHGDHRPGNILNQNGAITIIDFDEPIYHWFMGDIVKPFMDLCNTPFNIWKEQFESYINGYQTMRPIDENEFSHINLFVQMKSIEIYLWCKNNWHEPTAPGGKDKEIWLDELKDLTSKKLFPD